MWTAAGSCGREEFGRGMPRPLNRRRDMRSPEVPDTRPKADVRSSRQTPARDARRQSTVLALQGAIVELLRHTELQNITVDAVAKQANISRATFYRYHATIRDLFDAAVSKQLGRLLDLSLARFREDDKIAGSMRIIHYIGEHKTFWNALLTGGAAMATREALCGLARARSADIVSDIRGDLPADHFAAWSVAGTAGILTWWLRQDQPVDSAELAQYLHRLTVQPSLR